MNEETKSLKKALEAFKEKNMYYNDIKKISKSRSKEKENSFTKQSRMKTNSRVITAYSHIGNNVISNKINSYTHNAKNPNLILKYPIPKNERRQNKNTNFLFYSNSAKLISNESDKKVRAVSYSPKNSKHLETTKSKISYINKIQKHLPFPKHNTATNSPTHQREFNLTTSLEIRKLPKVNENSSIMTSGSTREKQLDTADTNSANNNQMLSYIYSKLMEYKICNSHTKHLNIGEFMNYFSEIFECLPTCNETGKKISETIKYLIENSSNDKSNSEKRNMHNSHYSTDSIHSIDVGNIKKELKDKESLIKHNVEKISELDRTLKEKENYINTLGKKYNTTKQNYFALKDENKNLKMSNKDLSSELEFLRNKEIKMMEVMYLLQKRGVMIDDVLKEKSMVRHENSNTLSNNSTLNDLSVNTVYFPDKIHIHDPNKFNPIVPPLNFNNIPEYESPSEDENKKCPISEGNNINESDDDNSKPKNKKNSKKYPVNKHALKDTLKNSYNNIGSLKLKQYKK